MKMTKIQVSLSILLTFFSLFFVGMISKKGAPKKGVVRCPNQLLGSTFIKEGTLLPSLARTPA